MITWKTGGFSPGEGEAARHNAEIGRGKKAAEPGKEDGRRGASEARPGEEDAREEESEDTGRKAESPSPGRWIPARRPRSRFKAHVIRRDRDEPSVIHAPGRGKEIPMSMFAKKTKVMSLRLDPAVWDQLELAARGEGLSNASEYVRRLIHLNAQSLVELDGTPKGPTAPARAPKAHRSRPGSRKPARRPGARSRRPKKPAKR